MIKNMQLLPPMSPEAGRVQIADEAINRIPSNGGVGIYAQPRRSSQRSIPPKGHDIYEKDLGLDGDDRDVRKAQVGQDGFEACVSYITNTSAAIPWQIAVLASKPHLHHGEVF